MCVLVRRLEAAALGPPSGVDGDAGVALLKGETLHGSDLTTGPPRAVKRESSAREGAEEGKFGTGCQVRKLSEDVTVVLPVT